MTGEADELAPLSDEVRAYVDAFATEEQPSPGTRVATWSAVERAVEQERWHVIGSSSVLAVLTMLALALALALDRC